MRPLRLWLDELFLGTRPDRVLLRVDAGNAPGLGFGHLSRCLLLSRCLRREWGCSSLYCMRNWREGVAHAETAGEDVLRLPRGLCSKDETEAVLAALEESRAQWLLHDLPYPFDHEALFARARAAGVRVLFVDDSRFISPLADVVLNSHVLAGARVPRVPGVEYFLGIEHFVYDHEFKARQAAHGGPLRLLLSFGGADPTRLTVRVLQAFEKIPLPPMSLTVLLGPGYGEECAILARWEAKEGVRVIRNSADPLALFREQDLVLCSGGRTMYELLSLGVGFVPVASAPHEVESIQALVDQGWISEGLVGLEQLEHSLLARVISLRAQNV